MIWKFSVYKKHFRVRIVVNASPEYLRDDAMTADKSANCPRQGTEYWEVMSQNAKELVQIETDAVYAADVCSKKWNIKRNIWN